MMKNKTGLVALIVLAAATLLMVFFVLPNMNKDKPAETPVATLTDATTAGGGETTTANGKKARTTSDQTAVDGEKPATEATKGPIGKSPKARNSRGRAPQAQRSEPSR